MISNIQIFKGEKFRKMYVELMYVFSAHSVLMFYICTKFHENISECFRVIEGLDFQYSRFYKGTIL